MTHQNVPASLDAPAPQWFEWAINRPHESHQVVVEGCPINYLVWTHDDKTARARGLLFVHGGGAHARWWQFIAPFFTRDFRVAALDLSGMGDSGLRDDYPTDVHAQEIEAVLSAAELGHQPFVVGHSYGGFMTMRFAADRGHQIGGAVIVDSPIQRPEDGAETPGPPPDMRRPRLYPDFETGASRFSLRPKQSCENDFIVEFIAKHSLKPASEEEGWTWKFDPNVMHPRRFGEPFHQHLAAVTCRAALIFGEQSALVSRATATYMSELMGPVAPVVEIPEAQHHVMLDQPLAFVAALRTLLDVWVRN
ncbi:MAG: alpha/beta hydrolase [Chromatiales bacterium]|jgi:pimeloyl-ACP methyl ester carboxylesterase|nr:alpha/beta hydrolase [Chromatiales bacterium]